MSLWGTDDNQSGRMEVNIYDVCRLILTLTKERNMDETFDHYGCEPIDENAGGD